MFFVSLSSCFVFPYLDHLAFGHGVFNVIAVIVPAVFYCILAAPFSSILLVGSLEAQKPQAGSAYSSMMRYTVSPCFSVLGSRLGLERIFCEIMLERYFFIKTISNVLARN